MQRRMGGWSQNAEEDDGYDLPYTYAEALRSLVSRVVEQRISFSEDRELGYAILKLLGSLEEEDLIVQLLLVPGIAASVCKAVDLAYDKIGPFGGELQLVRSPECPFPLAPGSVFLSEGLADVVWSSQRRSHPPD